VQTPPVGWGVNAARRTSAELVQVWSCGHKKEGKRKGKGRGGKRKRKEKKRNQTTLSRQPQADLWRPPHPTLPTLPPPKCAKTTHLDPPAMTGRPHRRQLPSTRGWQRVWHSSRRGGSRRGYHHIRSPEHGWDLPSSSQRPGGNSPRAEGGDWPPPSPRTAACLCPRVAAHHTHSLVGRVVRTVADPFLPCQLMPGRKRTKVAGPKVPMNFFTCEPTLKAAACNKRGPASGWCGLPCPRGTPCANCAPPRNPNSAFVAALRTYRRSSSRLIQLRLRDRQQAQVCRRHSTWPGATLPQSAPAEKSAPQRPHIRDKQQGRCLSRGLPGHEMPWARPAPGTQTNPCKATKRASEPAWPAAGPAASPASVLALMRSAS